ncbi:hypothetical protein PHMEG_00028846 [Phytophthora megakarya]|uniref:Uncharacterized protein n=1 Tax=Phytophthora megakarya TaxID=4795 RepID=A0A225V4Y8_9STRA|nr:hypothetical protein PHMEG_00028846 [Phytophthora megakarya]
MTGGGLYPDKKVSWRASITDRSFHAQSVVARGSALLLKWRLRAA